MLQIIVPMAGAGSRFAVAGYTDPKPLIPVHGVPMIKVVIDNLTPNCPHRFIFIFICQADQVATYSLREKLNAWAPGCDIVELGGLTGGAACSVYAARHLLDYSQQVMIANSDQYVDVDINAYLQAINESDAAGLIMTMKASDPKWSFVGFSAEGLITRVVEKEVISDEATVGIYNFRNAGQLISAIETMVMKDLRVNGEFYVAPAYNEIIGRGAKVIHYSIGAEGHGMYGLGIPADLNQFLSLPLSRQAASGRQA
ncbi:MULTISPECIES: glycosyltransferase family 2 protein [Pseudomonas]|uniref:Glycosyltransferase family 2 protein n=2 Tax=Pseudomonas savastanoi TaxID=29438 RepID=A0AAW5J504_PSESS|nr:MULTISPECIES: glycosyltransferase family 2 protein [Pseudomonas]ARD14504.1 glycosyl transferase family 2 [Pseudomonas savastanoi pv. savastanoi NCPPB 3335]KAA3548042.1 glycosyl transferase family 2 [Pseudomonas savastanoi]KPW73355.1 putative capsular polysaccharide biosynthesis protein [Pseudomonas amygdali pv. ciccaronei]KWS63579.1 glycosyl transferase family 2 [Pseudomonas savastanoi pv. fraxini]MBA4703236.1 glycosyltransferase family 2 protein [Pseudomonas savastanoi pv. savastanoi]